MKVINEIVVKEKNHEILKGNEVIIKIESHWDGDDKVIINVDGETFAVDTDELRAAVNNAANLSY